jgi:hypothetical protein
LAYFSQKGRQNYAYFLSKSIPYEKNMAVFSKETQISAHFPQKSSPQSQQTLELHLF